VLTVQSVEPYRRETAELMASVLRKSGAPRADETPDK
jgi:hypothetical protein